VDRANFEYKLAVSTMIDFILLFIIAVTLHCESKTQQAIVLLSHMPIGMLGIYWLLFFCLFLCPQNFGNGYLGHVLFLSLDLVAAVYSADVKNLNKMSSFVFHKFLNTLG